jgi:UDP-N-acetylglucosamine 2-epimerase
MPEELNRVMVDHISDSLYAPTQMCKVLLERENVYGYVECFGDVSVDILANMMRYAQRPFENKYILSTVHRPSNINSIVNLTEILSALNDSPHEVIFPIHPRTENIVRKFDLFKKYKNISFTSPFNYHKMIQYLQFSEMIVTDSGGIQKEAYLLKVPCITLRSTTEWHETLENGWNQLTPIIERGLISNAIISMEKPLKYTKIFGEVGVSKKIVSSLKTLYEV